MQSIKRLIEKAWGISLELYFFGMKNLRIIKLRRKLFLLGRRKVYEEITGHRNNAAHTAEYAGSSGQCSCIKTVSYPVRGYV